jgi:hypothetical protein
MSAVFNFFLRLFFCFVAARFLTEAIKLEGRGYLVALTIFLMANVYWFSYLVFRDRTSPPASPPAAKEPPRSPAGPEA